MMNEPAAFSRQAISETSVIPAVRGYLLSPANPGAEALVLTHGAGGNTRSSLLAAVAESFVVAGFTVLCCELPFRQERPYGPPRPSEAARDRAGLKNAVGLMRSMIAGRVFLGGHSYGGRQATMLCADEPGLVDGLLLLSYPLHPPRKPEQLRTQHLPELQVPSLFIHGTRDPFGSIAEMQAALKLIPAKKELVAVEGAGHDLGFKGKVRKEELPAQVLREFSNLIRADP